MAVRDTCTRGAAGQAQAIIPLPLNTECKLTVIGTVTDTTSIIFPPFPRFVPVDAEEIESYAYANYYSIPAGATAFISLMIAGLFLLGIARKNADWSLIPLPRLCGAYYAMDHQRNGTSFSR